MQQKLQPLLLLTAAALATVVQVDTSVGQDPTAFPEDGRTPGYQAAWPYPPGGQVVVPGPPNLPAQASRPEGWPDQQADTPPAAPGPWDPRSSLPDRAPARTAMEPCEGAQILARVGSQVVLASEVLPAIDEMLAPYKDRVPSHQLEMQRRLLIEQQLKVPIETKLIYLDACRKIPKENLPKVEKTLGEQFEKTELPKMLKGTNVETRWELDRKLRQMGTSLERRKQAFIQRALAQSWAHEQLTLDEEISYDEMLEYYRQHPEEFDRPVRARWEELMVRLSKYRSKDEAHAAIAEMGNQVIAGVPLAEVAKGRSDGPTAAEGGQRDWTGKGSLVCEELDRALFGLPTGQLSPILESENALHIIRVTQRELGGRLPFDEAQPEIRPKIRQQRAKRQWEAYVARLRQQIPVWTIFDDEARAEQVSGRDGLPRR